MSKITAQYRVSALRNGIVVRPSHKPGTEAPTALAHAAMIEMANLGFIVKVDELQGMSKKSLTEMLASARAVMGADRDWTAIYPGFPEQVEALDTMTLLVEQIMHYWTGGAFLPDYPTVAREGLALEDMLRNAREVKVLSAAATARELARKLATNPIALSEDDRALMEACLASQVPSLDEVASVCKDARNGENMQSYLRAASAQSNATAAELLAAALPAADNLDQVLRSVLVLASKPSDVKWEENYARASQNLADSCARSVRMDKLNRPTRRLVLNRVGELSRDFKADSLMARQDLWRVVMRAVHPYDFKLTDAQRRAADVVHSNVEYKTLNSLVEEAMDSNDVKTVVSLLEAHQPGNLLRRVVAILRRVSNQSEAKLLAEAIERVGSKAKLTTLVSAYNGVIAANSEGARVTRVAGLTNSMVDRKDVKKVSTVHLTLVSNAITLAIAEVLKTKAAPKGAVGVKGDGPVPLVRRDASTSDRVLDRGQEIGLVGEGDVLRIFGHWNNNMGQSSYMDIGVVVLDEDCTELGVSTWNSWQNARSWSTYSGDKLVSPGDSAPEYIDVKMKEVRKALPRARYIAMTVQAWAGWPMSKVDFIAGAMLRSDATKGKTFDARSVATAFKPTTDSSQAVPFVVDLESGKMVWIDSSSGGQQAGVSSTNDGTIGAVVYDELLRPRLTMGELALMWAEAHDVEVSEDAVNRDDIVGLLD